MKAIRPDQCSVLGELCSESEDWELIEGDEPQARNNHFPGLIISEVEARTWAELLAQVIAQAYLAGQQAERGAK